ncbi:MAG: ribosome biogenesis GTPase Der [Planctomycetaceae bacterium]|nr:ribosome biogenesis GTPase Der [Planctomycetaceae bacterium]
MGIPKVAIAGRPNVGKSSLLNWLADRLISVVDPTAGVTRDRVTWIMHEDDRYFEIIDTGGIGIVDSDDLSEDIERHISMGIDEADVLLFVVDAKSGITPLDEEVARRLRRSSKPTMLVVNKCDSPRLDDEAVQFLQLADLPYVTTSVKANRGRDDLIDAIVEMLPPAEDQEQQQGDRMLAPADMRIAVVGRRNVGKSTFINQLAQCERVIVSEIPGTTRDSIDIRFEMDGRAFVAIDTPGVRKRKSLENDIEFYGLVRAQRSIRRADLVLMFFDATQTISRVDKQLVEEIGEHYKPCIFVINKWDRALEEKMTTEKWVKYLMNSFESMRHVPMAIITAKDGRNIRKLINLAQSVHKQANLRMSTARLNKAVRMAIERNQPPMRKNRRPKIYFASQIAGSPPTIVLKCNDSTLLDEAWKRYLLGFLREATPFQEVPIRLVLRGRGETDPDLLSGDDDANEPAELSELSDAQITDGEADLGDDEAPDAGDILSFDDEGFSVRHGRDYIDAELDGEDGEDGEFSDEEFEEDLDEPAPNFVDDDDLPPGR